MVFFPFDKDSAPYIIDFLLKYEWFLATYQGVPPIFVLIWISILLAADIAPLGLVKVFLLMNWLGSFNSLSAHLFN